MNDILPNALNDYKAILAPFIMLTSCATLVWGLQMRFSRVYHAIRTLVSEGQRDSIDYTHSLESQISCLKKRAYYLRNCISGLYISMAFNLTTAILLTLTLITDWPLQYGTVVSFLCGLIFVCGSLVAATIETSRSYGTLQEELSHR